MKINYPAVIVAAIIHWILGGVWYAIFSKPFTAFIGSDKLRELESHSEAMAFLLAFMSSLIIAYLLARLLRLTRAESLFDALKIVFLVWLGFIAATQLTTVLFEARNLGLYLLGVGYQLVACALAGTILVFWRPRQTADSVSQSKSQIV